MFTWLKKLLGTAPATQEVAEVVKVNTDNAALNETVEVKAEQPKKKTTTKKPATKKATKKTTKKTTPKVDLEGMSKPVLLAYAKDNGIKANASMKKADILAAIKNG